MSQVLRCHPPPSPSLSPRIDSWRCREAPPRKSNTGCTMHVTDKTDAASGAHIEAKLSPPLSSCDGSLGYFATRLSYVELSA